MDYVYGGSGKPQPKPHGIEVYAVPGDGGRVPLRSDSNARVDPVFGGSGKPEPKPTQVEKAVVAVSGAVQGVVQVAKAISDSPGAAPVHAYVRQGVDEATQVLPAFPSQGIQPVSEMGQLFEPTPAEADRQLVGKVSLSDILQAGGVKEAQRQKEMER